MRRPTALGPILRVRRTLRLTRHRTSVRIGVFVGACLLMGVGVAVAATAEGKTTTLTLRQCVQLGWQKSPVAGAAGEEVAAARLKAISASLWYAPDLELQSGGVLGSQMGRTPTGAVGTNPVAGFLVRLSLTQHLFDSGISRAELRQAQASLTAERYSQGATTEELTLEVVERFYAVLTAADARALAEQAVARAEKYVATASAKFEAGRVARSDVSRAAVQLAEAKLRQLAAGSAVRTASVALWQVMGLSLDTEAELVDADDPLREANPLELQALDSAEHPAIQALRASLRADAASVKLARLNEGPQLAVDGSYNLDLLSSEVKARDWTVFAGLGFPIFDWDMRKRATKELAARMEAHRLSLADRAAALRSELKRAGLDYRQTRDAVTLAQAQVEDARESLRLSSLMYEVGRTPITDVIDAELALTRSESNLTAARYDERTALARLYYAGGVLRQKFTGAAAASPTAAGSPRK
jgi:outer membrane protein